MNICGSFSFQILSYHIHCSLVIGGICFGAAMQGDTYMYCRFVVQNGASFEGMDTVSYKGRINKSAIGTRLTDKWGPANVWHFEFKPHSAGQLN